tara:strand:- start:4990 stop:5979 length:990 start_codon:yes stop_codon:yes gene_type:complete
MRTDLIKIGVIGVGHLGQYHVKHLKHLPESKLVGIFDSDKKRAKHISNQYDVKCFDSLETLLEEIDAASIVVPTKLHSQIAELCINKKIHVFIEKPITETLEQANHIIRLAKKNKVIIQVGHIERLNPALRALSSYKIFPKFIELQRLAPYTSRGTDVPVVLDKMIHDIDILLSLVDSSVQTIQATGLSILTNSLDIAHARIRFKNGTVASIMSSRIAQDEVRKIKLFQKNLYVTIDLLIGLTEVYEIGDSKESLATKELIVPFNYKDKNKFISYEKPKIIETDPLRMELVNFILSIKEKEKPIVSGEEGRDALKVALEIQKLINQDLN